MTDYELDVTADQIVRWLKSEPAGGRRPLQIRATREYVTEAVGATEAFEQGDEAQVASLVTIGLLEVKPIGDPDGWILTVRVEDVVGPHAPDDEEVSDIPEEIDLDAFEADFVAPDRCTAYVSVGVETAKAKRHFDRMFADLLRDRHRA